MRGLTAAEREFLSGSGEASEWEDANVFPGLLARGLCREETVDGVVMRPNTDLGALALRVCPVGEP